MEDTTINTKKTIPILFLFALLFSSLTASAYAATIQATSNTTLYFTTTTATVNNQTANSLTTLNTATANTLTTPITTQNTTYGFRLFLIHTGGRQNEITQGSPIALVNRTTNGAGIQTNTYTPPQTILNTGFDAIKTVIYQAFTPTFKVTTITLTNGGSGYTTPSVIFTGGGGSGASANVQVSNGVIYNITILNGGSGYTSAPTITFSDPNPSHQGATATTTTDSTWTWTATANFITPNLLNPQLTTSTWTFNLWTNRTAGTSTSIRYGNSTYNSNITGTSFTTPTNTETQTYNFLSGNYIGFIFQAYTNEIGAAAYLLFLLIPTVTLYFRHRNFGPILILFGIFGGSGGMIYLFIPGWAASVAYLFLILGFGFMLWRIIR
jgi:hypothetical protein